MVGSVIAARMQSQMIKGGSDADKEADLLCGDTIVNYKTV